MAKFSETYSAIAPTYNSFKQPGRALYSQLMAIALQRAPRSQLKSPYLDYSLFANVE
ncbi:hypothetical protein [Oscillatoria nigro-viridis]|uniref:hypothetical protein n=1 Tax=Phormidium nigroviride TaxID=482564 RepID=UPI0002F15C3B|nr:hypothetical protein [Oscillatoria nigro-viridis]